MSGEHNTVSNRSCRNQNCIVIGSFVPPKIALPRSTRLMLDTSYELRSSKNEDGEIHVMTKKMPMLMQPQLIIGNKTVLALSRYFLMKNLISGAGTLKKRYPEMTLRIGTEHLKRCSKLRYRRGEWMGFEVRVVRPQFLGPFKITEMEEDQSHDHKKS